MRYYTTAKLSENMHETPEGFLLCVGVPIARVGEYEYMDGETPLECDDDGRVMITRDADEVFREETICSFEGKPITIGHPPDSVTPQNWSRLAKGYIQNVHQGDPDDDEDENDLISDLLITDHDAIQLVKNGLREVSLGYDADYTQTGPGKGFQSKLVGNHLALVNEGRAGPAYSIRDEKGKSVHTKLKEKLEGIMSEVKALLTLAEASVTRDGKAKAGKARTTDRSAKDEDKDDRDDRDNKEKKTDDDSGSNMPNVLEAIEALTDKIDAITKTNARDEDPDDADERRRKDKKESTEDDDGDENDIMARMDRVEAAVAKILKKLDADEDTEADEDADEDQARDGKNEGGARGTEDDMPKSTYTGDKRGRASDEDALASHMEILAPGQKFKGKDAKAQALRAAYKTDDGKAVIDKLTGKKGLTKDAAIDTLFVAAAELLSTERETTLSGTRRGKVLDEDSADTAQPMTAEKLNELNAKYYARA